MERPQVLINALAMHAAADGARTFLEEVTHELPTAWPDAELHVVVARDWPWPLEDGVSAIRVRTHGSGVARLLADLTRLPAIADELRADVVISPNESAPTRLAMPLVVVAQNLLFHCPAVGPLPGGPPLARLRSKLQFAFYRRYMPRVYRRADAVVAVSRHAAHALAERAGLDLSRVTVVPCGSDRLPTTERRDLDARRLLLVVGSVAHYKRLPIVIEALAHLRRAGGDYELVLAGEEWPGYGRVVDDLALAAGVGTAVRRIGGIPREDLAELLATAHATLSLSLCESFGIPVVEAMRAGLPAVVADEPWTRELVGHAAVRVDATCPQAVAAGVRVLEDRSEWERRSAVGREVAARYTWARTARGLADVASDVLAECHRTGRSPLRRTT